MTLFLAILALLALLASSYGLGFVIMKWVVRDEANCFSLLAVIGVACLVVLGGILNLIGMAYPVAMYALLLLGLTFFMLSFFDKVKMLTTLSSSLSNNSIRKTNLLDRLLPLFLITIAVIFFAITLLPSDAFNYHDDFQTYIPRPIRMLQTGTLGGNPFELLGLDSLGAQAFLQGFILLNLPIEYLPGFDTVFGMGLAGLLLTAIARKFNLPWVYSIPAILTFFVINPQSVNVSALYSSVFIVLGLLLTSCMLTERLNEEVAKPLGMSALVGLLISSLVALKTTLGLFAAIYSTVFCLGLFVITQNKRRAALLTTIAGLAAVIAILPWLLLHLPNYMAALNSPAHIVGGEQIKPGFSLPKGNVSELFSIHTLFYGGSLLGYGAIILVLAVLGIFSLFFMLRSNRDHVQQRGYSLVSASACAAAIATYFLNGLLFDPEAAVRYACPVLIATLPFALLASSFNVTTSPESRQLGSLVLTPLKMAVLGGVYLVAVFFGNNFVDRIVLAYSKRTTVSFQISDTYIKYNHYVFSEEAQRNIRNIQNQTETGAKILAWISMPLNLDFARNKIQTVMEPGLNNPWLNLPLDGDPANMVKYLKKQGIRYIMWEYKGAGMKDPNQYQAYLSSPYPLYRQIAERNLYMRKMLISILTGRTVLYNLNGIVLFDLNQIS